MVHRTLTFLAGSVVALAVGAVAVQVAAPAAAAPVEAFIREHLIGWDYSACRSLPAECLTSKYQTLADRERKLSSTIRLLQSEGARIGRVVEDRELVLQKNYTFLDQGREALLAAEASGETPIVFANRRYPDAGTFRQQMSVLYAEQPTLVQSVSDARDLEGRLNGQTQKLVIQHANVRAARELVPGKLALVQGNQVFAEFEENIDLIDDALSASDTGLLDAVGLLGSTQELIASETGSGNIGAGIGGTNQSFEDFLRDGRPAIS